MDKASLTPEEVERLTPLDFERLTPDQKAAALESLDAAFHLTPEEQLRREASWRLADATAWRRMAASCITHIVESYGCAELDMQGAVDAMHRVAIGCWTQDRVLLFGLMVALARRREPPEKKQGQRPPRWPLWLRNATAVLVLEGKARRPDLRRWPLPAYREDDVASEPGDGTSPLINWALAILTSIGWFGAAGAPTPGTVDDWVRAWLKQSSPVPRQNLRPSSVQMRSGRKCNHPSIAACLAIFSR